MDSQEDGQTELKNENRQLKELIARMQAVKENRLGKMDPRPFPPRPEPPCDDVMMSKMFKQTMNTRDFSRQNAVEVGDLDLKEVAGLRTEDAAAIKREEAWLALQAPAMKKRASKMLLEAWLNRLIATLITLESLHHLDEIDHDDLRHANGPFKSLIQGLEESK